jgi:hypothetical protein
MEEIGQVSEKISHKAYQAVQILVSQVQTINLLTNQQFNFSLNLVIY